MSSGGSRSGAEQTAEQRAFYRVQPGLPITCVVMGADGQPAAGPPGMGVVANISAGGLRIITNVTLAMHNVLRVRLALPLQVSGAEEKVLEAYARVRRVAQLPDRAPPHFDVALQLIFEHEAERDDWVALIAELQK
jgi:hypothetical protein